MPDNFDRMIGALTGLPDVAHTKATTVRALTPLIGASQTFIIQTYRRREIGDTIFLEYIGAGETLRIALPPEVADTIARQRDALTTTVRRKVGKAQAADRKARGILPGFLKAKRKGKK